MILDRIDNADMYAAASPRFARAFAALRDPRFVAQPDGRYDIDGDRVFALIQRYTTRPPEKCNVESHRRYIDIQFMVDGVETVRVANHDGLEPTIEYDGAGDKLLYRPAEAMSAILLGAQSFAVFFPHDAHMPCMQAGTPSDVHKVVIKVLAGD